MSTTTATKSVVYALTDADLNSYFGLLAKRQKRSTGFRDSIVTALLAPLALGGLAMAWAAYARSSSDAFGVLLIAGGIAYLTGVLALRHEVLSNHRRKSVELNRNDPLYRGERRLTLRDDDFEFALPLFTQHYKYAALQEVEIKDGLLLGWMGAGGIAIPVAAFATPADATAFADILRQRAGGH